MLYDLLKWDMNYRYRILGYRIKAEGEQIYIFDLLEPEYVPDGRKKKSTTLTIATEDSSEPKRAGNPRKDKNFGVSLEENQAALQLDLLDYQACDEIENTKGG